MGNKVVTLRLEPDEVDLLDNYAAKLNINRSEVVRNLIKASAKNETIWDKYISDQDKLLDKKINEKMDEKLKEVYSGIKDEKLKELYSDKYEGLYSKSNKKGD